MQITGKTKIVGILGREISYTLSPRMHNHAFRALDLDYVYIPIEVEEGDDKLNLVLQGISSNSNFVGANVTIPFKNKIIKYLNSITQLAEDIGAVNTILKKNGKLLGDNTDMQGFLDSLESMKFDPKGKHSIIFGSGGTAHAISYGLLKSGVSSLTILSRNPENGKKLLNRMKALFKGNNIFYKNLYSEDLENEVDRCDLLVSTIPKGLSPELLSRLKKVLKKKTFIFDVNYHKLTRIIKMARNIGAPHLNGLTMLIHQGARSFSKWTNEEISPVKYMKKELHEELNRSYADFS